MSIVLLGSTSGSCTLQEQAVAGTTVLTLPTVSGTVLTDTSPKAGNVLQVVSATKTDKFSSAQSAGVYVDVTGLSVSITPTSTSSKILVMASVLMSTQNNAYQSLTGLRIARNGTFIGTGSEQFASSVASVTSSDNDSAYASVPLLFLDSPSSTSALTYNIQIAQRIGGSVNIQVNAARGGGQLGSSTITVMEIAG